MSATMSASTGMPYLKPKLTTVTFSETVCGGAERIGDLVGELVHVEGAGVDHQVGVGAQVGERGPLPTQAVEQPTALLQRVRATGRLLTADQHVVDALEEQQRRATPGAALGEHLLQAGEERAGAHVDDDRDRLQRAAGLVDEPHHVGDQLRGQVVDDEVAEVLELLGGGAAARPGHAGDDDDLAAVRGAAPVATPSGAVDSSGLLAVEVGIEVARARS